MLCSKCKTFLVDEDETASCEACHEVYCWECLKELRTTCGHTICRRCTHWVPAEYAEYLNGHETCPICCEETSTAT